MVAPVEVIQVLQYGPEATPGTLVPATRVVDYVPGTASWKRNMVPIVRRNAGSYATSHAVYAGQESTELDYTANATFDRLTDVGNLYFNTVASGSGSGATRTWTFAPPDTSDGLKRFSYEIGGTNFPSGYTLSGATGKSLGISIQPNMPWQLKQTVLGMVTAPASITPALSLPSSLGGDDVLWSQTRVYIDAATFGSTQMAGRIVSADITLANGVEPRHTLDGVSTPYRIALAKERAVDATIVAEYDSQTQYTAWAAATTQKVRIEATGNNSRKATIDINGFWETVPMGNDNGVITLQMKLKGMYDATLTSDLKLVVINGVTTLAGVP